MEDGSRLDRSGPKASSATGGRMARLGSAFADSAEGARFSRFTRSLFNAFRYALTEATMVSVSAPCPFTVRPASSSRTVTSACASVPPVTA